MSQTDQLEMVQNIIATQINISIGEFIMDLLFNTTFADELTRYCKNNDEVVVP